MSELLRENKPFLCCLVTGRMNSARKPTLNSLLMLAVGMACALFFGLAGAQSVPSCCCESASLPLSQTSPSPECSCCGDRSEKPVERTCAKGCECQCAQPTGKEVPALQDRAQSAAEPRRLGLGALPPAAPWLWGDDIVAVSLKGCEYPVRGRPLYLLHRVLRN